MREYIENIKVHDSTLAFKVMTSLEKDGLYSCEYYYGPDQSDPVDSMKNVYDIRIYREIKNSSQAVGFSGEEKDDDSN